MAKEHANDLKKLYDRLRIARRALVKQLIAGDTMSDHDLDRFTKAQTRLEVVAAAMADEDRVS